MLQTANGGFMYWRGVQVEHYDRPHEMTEQAQDLTRRCEHLETLGVQPTSNTAVWFWNWFKDAEPGPETLMLARLVGTIWENAQGLGLLNLANHLALIQENAPAPAWSLVQHTPDKCDPLPFDPPTPWSYHGLVKSGWHIADLGQGKDLGSMYASRTAVLAWCAVHGLTPDLVFQLVPARWLEPDIDRPWWRKSSDD